jgi:hypothetical protein
MHNETTTDLARILAFAATYMEEHGRARFSFGARPGQPLCPAAAIALALGCNPRRLGRGWLFLPANEVHHAVGSVILRSGLLSRLPVPGANGRRKLRPATISPYRAVRELARWSDDKALSTLVIGALREQAFSLSTRRGQEVTSGSELAPKADLALPGPRVLYNDAHSAGIRRDKNEWSLVSRFPGRTHLH